MMIVHVWIKIFLKVYATIKIFPRFPFIPFPAT